ncbi:hypothetical protein HaLaN_32339, partial [Haematococcus lacustris]
MAGRGGIEGSGNG